MKSKVFISIFAILTLVINQIFVYPVFGEEYVVSGNGEGSSNSINVSKENSETVKQDNEAEVKNEVATDSSTGNNEANENSGGEIQVESGDAKQEVKVENSGNINTTLIGCCLSEDESLAVIKDNGAESNNNVNYAQSTNTAALQNNTAKITNNIQVNADTGDNAAFGNSGDTTIRTGDANIYIGVIQNANNSYLKLSGGDPGFNMKIAGNGEGSTNVINEQYNNSEEFLVNNYLDVTNNIKTSINTGRNMASGNNGNVLISTGDVYLDIILNNKFNTSVVIADCGCKSTPPLPTPGPSETPTPSTPPSSGGGSSGGSSGGSGGSSDSGSSSGSSGSGGQVLGAALPATGGFSLIQASLFALSLLLSGIILRLDFKKSEKYVKKLKRDIIFDYVYQLAKVCRESINCKLPTPVPRDLYAHYQSVFPFPYFPINY